MVASQIKEKLKNSVFIHKYQHTLRLSGNSDLPAYPGFMVINVAQDGSNLISVPSNSRVSDPELIPGSIKQI